MKALIVDDEPDSHVYLKNKLTDNHPYVEVLDSAYGVGEGLELINTLQPELLFLDIQMKDGTGFDLLGALPLPKFHLIFITAFDQYAQTAIRFGALDYLLKPVSDAELNEALLRVKLRHIEKIQLEQIQIVQETLKRLEQRQLPERISISTSKGVLYFSTSDIIRLEAMQNFTEFVVQNDGRRLIASHMLRKFEMDLKPYMVFMRVHRSYLINLLKVKRLIRGDKWYVEMQDEAIVPVSRRYRQDLENRLNEL